MTEEGEENHYAVAGIVDDAATAVSALRCDPELVHLRHVYLARRNYTTT